MSWVLTSFVLWTQGGRKPSPTAAPSSHRPHQPGCGCEFVTLCSGAMVYNPVIYRKSSSDSQVPEAHPPPLGDPSTAPPPVPTALASCATVDLSPAPQSAGPLSAPAEERRWSASSVSSCNSRSSSLTRQSAASTSLSSATSTPSLLYERRGSTPRADTTEGTPKATRQMVLRMPSKSHMQHSDLAKCAMANVRRGSAPEGESKKIALGPIDASRPSIDAGLVTSSVTAATEHEARCAPPPRRQIETTWGRSHSLSPKSSRASRSDSAIVEGARCFPDDPVPHQVAQQAPSDGSTSPPSPCSNCACRPSTYENGATAKLNKLLAQMESEVSHGLPQLSSGTHTLGLSWAYGGTASLTDEVHQIQHAPPLHAHRHTRGPTAYGDPTTQGASPGSTMRLQAETHAKQTCPADFPAAHLSTPHVHAQAQAQHRSTSLGQAMDAPSTPTLRRMPRCIRNRSRTGSQESFASGSERSRYEHGVPASLGRTPV